MRKADTMIILAKRRSLVDNASTIGVSDIVVHQNSEGSVFELSSHVHEN